MFILWIKWNNISSLWLWVTICLCLQWLINFEMLALRLWIHATQMCIVTTKLAYNPNVYQMREPSDVLSVRLLITIQSDLKASGVNIVTSAPWWRCLRGSLNAPYLWFRKRRGLTALLDLHPWRHWTGPAVRRRQTVLTTLMEANIVQEGYMGQETGEIFGAPWNILVPRLDNAFCAICRVVGPLGRLRDQGKLTLQSSGRPSGAIKEWQYEEKKWTF